MAITPLQIVGIGLGSGAVAGALTQRADIAGSESQNKVVAGAATAGGLLAALTFSKAAHTTTLGAGLAGMAAACAGAIVGAELVQ